ncbi:GNAT family N-acetyltransferase [Chloroflexota bacterium]
MSELVEQLAWDSNFFGFSIGRIAATKLDEASITTLLEQARAQKLECLYFEADPNDSTTISVVERYGFHLVDVRIVLEHPFDNRPAPVPRYPVPPELFIGPFRPGEMSRLQDISTQIGLMSRFDFDEKFGSTQSERLYRLWIKNSCEGFADVVLVARWQQMGEAIGLITSTLGDDVAHIQLAGVHVDHRQRNVGTGLVQMALDWAKAQHAQAMQVVTQARNVPAQRLYQQMGFFTKSMTLFYHKWL